MTTTRQQAAAAFFRARLDFQTDVSDVHAALTAHEAGLSPARPSESGLSPACPGESGPSPARPGESGPSPACPGESGGPQRRTDSGVEHRPAFVLVDSRSGAAWDQGHIPGALHLPTADIPTRAPLLLDRSVPVVTYCWGPGCNGATRAALALSEAGFDAKEMLGGIEYWIREGFPVRTAEGEEVAEPDPLTAPRLIGVGAEAPCGC